MRKLRADISEKEGPLMARRTIILLSLLLSFFASLPSLRAQMPPAKKDRLSVLQGAQGKAACSTTEASSCAGVAPNILPVLMGSSRRESNLLRPIHYIAAPPTQP